MKIHVHRGSQSFGPYSPEEVRRYLSTGQLVYTDLAWREGMDGWQALARFPEFRRAAATPTVARSPWYRTISPLNLVVAAVCLTVGVVLTLGVLSAINVIPSTKVIPGEQLKPRDMAFLRDNGVIEPTEEVLYFYSAGMFSIKEDGNLLTDQRVISYYPDDETGGLIIESARYEEISDLQITYSKNVLEDTEVFVVLGGGDEDENGFLLYVSAEGGLDKTFVNDLRRRWQAARNQQSGEAAVNPTNGDKPAATPESTEATP